MYAKRANFLYWSRMDSSEARRQELGTFERAPALTAEHATLNVVVVLRLAGVPEAEVLGRACEILQLRHPLLGVRLAREGRRRTFEPADAPVPLRVVARRGEDDWRAVVEAELEASFDAAAGPLLRVTYLRSPEVERGEIVLCFHHVIVDATSGVRLCAELLALCAAIAAGGSAEASEPVPAAAPEVRFPPAFQGLRCLRPLASFLLRQLADEAIFRWRSRGKRKPTVHRDARSRITVFEVSKETTSRLARRARRRRVTLASALQAALLLAVSRHLYGGRQQPLRSFTFPDLRPYLRPPVPAERLGTFFAVVRFTVPVAGGQDFWQLARDIHRRIHGANRRGEKYAAALLSYRLIRRMFRARATRTGAAALSYTGVARLERSYGAAGRPPITVLGLHAFVSNTFLGPEHAAQARLWQGRLLWDVVFHDADMDRDQAERIVVEITDILERAALGPATQEQFLRDRPLEEER